MSARREEIVAILRLHRIECTGPGEVTCRACRELSWMSFQQFFDHLADLLVAAPAGFCTRSQNCRMAEGHEGGC